MKSKINSIDEFAITYSHRESRALFRDSDFVYSNSQLSVQVSEQQSTQRHGGTHRGAAAAARTRLFVWKSRRRSSRLHLIRRRPKSVS